MANFYSRLINISLMLPLLAGSLLAGDSKASFPKPALDDPRAQAGGQQTAVLAGGCFWGVQLVFQHVKGVSGVVSGYSGGAEKTAKYKVVSTGTTGHAESVKITYDPAKIS
jgi:peptide-methionine (S)-S-oxide reductase